MIRLRRAIILALGERSYAALSSRFLNSRGRTKVKNKIKEIIASMFFLFVFLGMLWVIGRMGEYSFIYCR